MEEIQKVWKNALIIILILSVVIISSYFLFIKKREPETILPKPKKEVTLPTTEEKKEAVAPVSMAESDDYIRMVVREISTHPKLAAWLKTKNIIRKFTAAVDNIANGQSPRKQIDFFSPRGSFSVVKKGDRLIIDHASYRRYDSLVDVFISLETKGCVSLFRSLKPLFQEAYRELGYPEADFETTLIKAILELLRTPIVENEIVVEKGIVNYYLVDPILEQLSDAQKHLLRMGPDNVAAIQMKLRELALALDVPEYRLPQPFYYRAKTSAD
ncbi:MAG: DUF3014 domain-containing protein [Candidatus Aminicenantes bacterium]|nr:DUF3014 domain-containing protein [Candidatus Aminicenantes bacterium]